MLLQGELQFIAVKGKMPQLSNYASGIYLTTNELPVIAGADGDAVYARVECFVTKKLTTVKKNVKRKFRNQCMEVGNSSTRTLTLLPH